MPVDGLAAAGTGTRGSAVARRAVAVIVGALAAAACVRLVLETSAGAYLVLFPIAYLAAFRLSGLGFAYTFSLVTLALVVRLASGFVIGSIIVFDDELGYVERGANAAHLLRVGAADPWHAIPFANFAAVLFWVFNPSIHVLKAFNMALGVVTAFMMHRVVAGTFASRRASVVTLYACLFLPPLIFVSAIALKEQMVAFALVATMLGLVTGGARGMVTLALGVGVLVFSRASLAVLVLPVVGVYVAIDPIRRWRASMPLRATVVTVAAGVVVLLMALLIRMRALDETKAYLILTGVDTRVNQTLAQRRSEFAAYLDTENPLALRNLVLTPIRALYAPSPLRPLKSPEPHIALESVAMTTPIYLALPFAILGVFAAGRRRHINLLVILYGLVFLASAYSVLTASPEFFRYRWPGLVIYFALAVQGWYGGPTSWRRAVIGAWWLSAAAFNVIYLL